MPPDKPTTTITTTESTHMGHTGIILLVKAESRQQAVKYAKEFLADYGDWRVYDYYRIGGGWSGWLTNYNPRDNPANLEFCSCCNGSGKSPSNANDPCFPCQGTGKSLKWELASYKGDVLPLRDVKEDVLKFLGSWREEALKRANEGIAKYEKEGDESMLGFYLVQKGNLLRGAFSWYSTVYDVENESNGVPVRTDGYWAVVVDMHS